MMTGTTKLEWLHSLVLGVVIATVHSGLMTDVVRAQESKEKQLDVMLRVVADSAEVVVGENGKNRVIEIVPKGASLYASKSNQNYYYVVAPVGFDQGWIRRDSVALLLLSAADQAFFDELNEISQALEKNRGKVDEPEMRRLQDRGLEICARLPMNDIKSLWAIDNFRDLQKDLLPSNDKLRLSLRYLRITQNIVGYEHRLTNVAYGVVLLSLSRFNAPRNSTVLILELESLHEQRLNYFEKKYGSAHSTVYGELMSLRHCRSMLQDYEGASRYGNRIVETLGKMGQVNDSKYIEEMKFLASDLELSGRDLLAEEARLKILELQVELHGKKSKEAVEARSEAARLYSLMSEHENAIVLCKQNIASIEHDSEASSERLQNVYCDLGIVYDKAGRPEEAILVYQKLISLAPSTSSPSTIGALKNNLAVALVKTGEFDRAKVLLEECIAFPDSDDLVNDYMLELYLTSLTLVHEKIGNLQEAEANCLASMAIAENRGFDRRSKRLLLSRILVKGGKFDQAERILKEIVEQENAIGLPFQSASRAEALTRLTDFYLQTIQPNHAFLTEDIAQQKIRYYSGARLPHLDPNRRLKFLSGEYRDGFDRAISMCFQSEVDQSNLQLAVGWMLNGKSLSEEVLSEAARFSSPKCAEPSRRLRAVRSQLASIAVQGSAPDEQTQRQLDELLAFESQLEKELAKLTEGEANEQEWIPTTRLRESLLQGTRFVTVAKFRPYDFDASFAEGIPVWKPERFAAWIVPTIGAGDVVCIDLGEAKTIDASVAKVRDQLVTSGSQFGLKGEPVLEAELNSSLRELSKLILTPLQPHLGKVKNLIVSPDGELWTIPWEALVTDDGKYLIETFSLRYVLSGRELVNDSSKDFKHEQAAIFADPDFSRSSGRVANETQEHPSVKRSSNSFQFPQLRASMAEAAGIKPSLESYVNAAARVFLQADANEYAFKQLHRPRILVLSTHGYFEQNHRVTNPLLRCGLALAGCNNRDQSAESGREDGILTGLEIVGTDLRGTELVVLSACETGLGDVTTGEGVAGLRQAFQLAGAESVVSSLWQVEDGETARLMKLFFENVANGMSKSEALRAAQLSRITLRRERYGAAHPFFWAAFTLTGRD